MLEQMLDGVHLSIRDERYLPARQTAAQHDVDASDGYLLDDLTLHTKHCWQWLHVMAGEALRPLCQCHLHHQMVYR